MKDDLISRKAVIKAVDKHKRDDGTLDDDISIILEEVETAFDKEKVIEELNSERNLMYREDGTLMGARTQISIDRAVDIVEKGGIE